MHGLWRHDLLHAVLTLTHLDASKLYDFTLYSVSHNTEYQAPTSLGSSSQQEDRLAGTKRYEINVSDISLLKVLVNRKQMARIFGGRSIEMCVHTAGRNFLYPKADTNPLLPRRPGMPGLLYRGNHELNWKGDLQTLFISRAMESTGIVGSINSPCLPRCCPRRSTSRCQKRYASFCADK